MSLYSLAANTLLPAASLDADFGMWAARILDGLTWDDFSELRLYDGVGKHQRKKNKKASSNPTPPMVLLGQALSASDGGVAAAGVFVNLGDGERWCAHTVGQALQESSSLADAFNSAIENGCECVARDLLEICLDAAEVDSNCAAPLVLAGMARTAAMAGQKRSEWEVRVLAAALLTSMLD